MRRTVIHIGRFCFILYTSQNKPSYTAQTENHPKCKIVNPSQTPTRRYSKPVHSVLSLPAQSLFRARERADNDKLTSLGISYRRLLEQSEKAASFAYFPQL